MTDTGLRVQRVRGQSFLNSPEASARVKHRMVSKIHHVGIVVESVARAFRFWRDTLGMPLVRSADLPDQGVRAALLAAGESEVELLEPLRSDTGVARFL